MVVLSVVKSYFCFLFKNEQYLFDMAIIQRLRNSKWVAIVIGSALVLFIVGDWLTGKGNGPVIDEDRDVIAIIGDEKVREAEIVSIADKYYRDELDRDPNYQLDKEK